MNTWSELLKSVIVSADPAKNTSDPVCPVRLPTPPSLNTVWPWTRWYWAVALVNWANRVAYLSFEVQTAVSRPPR